MKAKKYPLNQCTLYKCNSKRKLERTGTDGISVENVKLSDVIRQHKDSSKKYIDSIQATMPGMTGRKIFSIREQIKLI